jgi:predicted metalloprotease
VIIEPGDVDEGTVSLFEAGDDLPWFDPRAHGTGDQRREAFTTGRQSGYKVCFN